MLELLAYSMLAALVLTMLGLFGLLFGSWLPLTVLALFAASLVRPAWAVFRTYIPRG